MKKQNTTPLWRFFLLVYSAVMVWLLFHRSRTWDTGLPYKELLRQNTNLIPLHTIRNYLYVLRSSHSRYLLAHCFLNLAGNFVLFIPAGWLLPRLWQKMRRLFPFLVWSISMLFMIEVVQLFTLLGRFDIDDLILNLLGMTAGLLLYTLFPRK